VLRTSNAFAFHDPSPADRSSKSDFQVWNTEPRSFFCSAQWFLAFDRGLSCRGRKPAQSASVADNPDHAQLPTYPPSEITRPAASGAPWRVFLGRILVTDPRRWWCRGYRQIHVEKLSKISIHGIQYLIFRAVPPLHFVAKMGTSHDRWTFAPFCGKMHPSPYKVAWPPTEKREWRSTS
jgi:hypothetical protein